jgi:tyrosyl-tRNA synthetase
MSFNQKDKDKPLITMAFWERIKKRNIIQQFSNENKIINAFTQKKAFYLGIDPTNNSLHLGHLLLLNALYFFSNNNEVPAILLLGTYTAQIGDPSGKQVERKMLPKNVVKRNSKQLLLQLNRLSDKINNEANLYNFLKINRFFNDKELQLLFNNVPNLLTKKIINSLTELPFPLLLAKLNTGVLIKIYKKCN